MSSGQWPFKPTQLERVFKAAKKAGVAVRVEIEPGKIVATTLRDGETANGTDNNPWDVAEAKLRKPGVQ
jgi:hypothetical protein